MSFLSDWRKGAKPDSETELKSLEFEALVKSLKDGVIAYDTDFKILSLNRAAEEILEVAAGEVVGERITPQTMGNPKLKTLVQVLYPTLASSATELSRDSWPQIVRIETENPPLTLHATLNRLTNAQGQTIGFIKVVRDETREKEIIESKSEFVSVAAHQLRTPLTALNWSLENLEGELGDKPELQEKLKSASDLVERMTKIVNDLLDAAKIEGGKFGYKFEDAELSEFLNQIISHVKPVAAEYGVEVRYEGGAARYGVRIDRDRLGMAVSNILDNAIRYNTKGGNVVISLETTDMRGSFVKVKISDSGVGIPQEDLAKLFEKFYRGSNVIQLEPNGSGLGLYIARNIIKRHGGDIGVESAVGRGTTVWVTLPLDKSLVPEKEVVYEE
ncbi:MAG: PAS domain-containing protein [Candidatus Brennerbacteria bacterium]|nr:PAS domain-containing protein [Candidatus Brennerbacteria bacterium]